MNQTPGERAPEDDAPSGAGPTALSAAVGIARHVGGLWAGLSVVTLAGFLLTGGGVAGFIALADEVLEGEMDAFDRAVLARVIEARVAWMDTVALQVTALGNVATLTVLVLTAAAILWAAHRRVSVMLLFASLATGGLATHVLKMLFDRPRPDLGEPLAEVLSASFPSGHAMMSAVTYGSVAFLVGRMARGPLRWATWTGAAALVVLIGLSRVYVGVHYPSDVAAGWLGGVAWTALLVLLFHMLGAFAHEMPELRAAEPEVDEGAHRR